jgi:hypothetical protein
MKPPVPGGGVLDRVHARALALTRRGDLAGARAVLEQALARAPDSRALQGMLKDLAVLASDWPRIRQAWERDLLEYPEPQREYTRAHVMLLFGELQAGWQAYEARMRIPGLIPPVRAFTQPLWDGAPFPGRTLLLHWEQGFGDTLMFLRYAPRVKALGGRVLLAAQRELADLAATCRGVDQVIAHGDELPPFDLQLPLLSLPRVFGTGLDAIPAEVPYLDVPEQVPHRAALAGLLAASRGKVRIGVVWAGRPTHINDRQRSLPAAALAPLGSLSGVAWHSFQLGPEPAPLPGIVALGPLLGSFSDTAYALSGMDLVVSADTAVAHLAGALAIPTLLLLPFQPDFRWLLERADSPWYPTLRLYRQPQPGDWATVIRHVLADLAP